MDAKSGSIAGGTIHAGSAPREDKSRKHGGIGRSSAAMQSVGMS
jgi:hypothetical protein